MAEDDYAKEWSNLRSEILEEIQKLSKRIDDPRTGSSSSCMAAPTPIAVSAVPTTKNTLATRRSAKSSKRTTTPVIVSLDQSFNGLWPTRLSPLLLAFSKVVGNAFAPRSYEARSCPFTGRKAAKRSRNEAAGNKDPPLAHVEKYAERAVEMCYSGDRYEVFGAH
jgi:hypothetical protein